MVEIKTNGMSTSTRIVGENGNDVRNEVCASCAGAIVTFYGELRKHGYPENSSRAAVEEMLLLVNTLVRKGIESDAVTSTIMTAEGLPQ